MSITIRRFEIKDYPKAIRLWRNVKLPLKPRGRDQRQAIEKEISRTDSNVFLVALHGKDLIGTIFGTHDGRKGWINRLAVHPDFQKRGIARQLVTEVEKQLEKQGIEITACLIEDYNQDSMDFFQKIGYRKHDDVIYFSKRKFPHT